VAAVTAAGGTITLLVGAVLLRLTVTDTYQRYVRVGMGPWLLVAGAAVLLLGVTTLVLAVRRVPVSDAHDHHENHDHGHGIGVGWLLLAPIAALLLVAPPTLGSYGVDRGATVDVRAGAPVFDLLPRSKEPRPMTLLEYGQRAFDHDGASFRRQPVQLTGFVTADDGSGAFRVARYQIACCAADAIPVVVRIVGTSGDKPPADEWVTVTGTFRRGQGDIPQLAATSITQIAPPTDPYE
jgi:uncharacterized repeat protein (TIGR03943 family)